MDFKGEMLRKSLHLTGLLVPASYFLFGKEKTLIFISLAIIIFFIIEPYRVSNETTKKIIEGIKPLLKEDKLDMVDKSIESINRKIMEITREEEKMWIGAHIYFAISALLVVLFFPKNIAMSVLSVATVSDAFAAIAGIKFGKHKLKNGKSLEGSLAFFLSALIIYLFFIPWHQALLVSLVGTIVELYNIPPNDNFSNPLVMAFTAYLLNLI